MAKVSELNTEQAEYLVNMIKSGKTAKEITNHFATEGLNVPAWKVFYIKNKMKASTSSPEKEKVRKTKKIHIKDIDTPKDLTDAVTSLEEEIKAFVECVRRTARKEIIGYVARIRKTRINMGEKISETEEKRLEAECKRLGIDMGEIEEADLN